MKLLKVKGSGAEARAEGPFHPFSGGKTAAARQQKALREREETPAHPPPSPSGKEGGANERQL